MPVAEKSEGKSKSKAGDDTVLERAILRRVKEGARFTCVRVAPSKMTGCTLIGCLRCGACLNLEHGYFGCNGLFDPNVVARLNDNTRDFWLAMKSKSIWACSLGHPVQHICVQQRLCDQDVA